MSAGGKPVVIFDTGCVLQAAINPAGPAADALDLMARDRPEGRSFRRRFPRLRILDPVAFLEVMRQQ